MSITWMITVAIPKHRLDDLLKECVVAVNVMSPLYKALNCMSDAANSFDTKPTIPLTAAMTNFKKGEIGTLLSHSKLKYIIVSDGSEHRAKKWLEHHNR
jgi:hypothetical protein